MTSRYTCVYSIIRSAIHLQIFLGLKYCSILVYFSVHFLWVYATVQLAVYGENRQYDNRKSRSHSSSHRVGQSSLCYTACTRLSGHYEDAQQGCWTYFHADKALLMTLYLFQHTSFRWVGVLLTLIVVNTVIRCYLRLLSFIDWSTFDC